MNLTKVLDLLAKLKPDTLGLFSRFVLAALASGDPNAYVRGAMHAALDGSVTVIEKDR